MIAQSPCYFEIHIHATDGSVSAFTQDDAETIRKVILQLQSGRMFTQPYLAIMGHRSLTVFPAGKITRVDILSLDLPVWSFYHGIDDAAEITEEEFRMGTPAVPDAPGHSRRVHTEIEMTNRERLYLQIQVGAQEEPHTRFDFGKLLQQLLTAPILHARRLDGGMIVVNPAHIMRVQFQPAPVQEPPNAWNADPIPAGRHLSRPCEGREKINERGIRPAQRAAVPPC